MPTDYYNDSDGEEQMPGATPNKEPREEMDERDEKTATIPKTITGGKDFEPGDEIVLEVVAVHESELEVRYATEKGGKGESEDETEEQPSMSRAMESNKTMSGMDEMY